MEIVNQKYDFMVNLLLKSCVHFYDMAWLRLLLHEENNYFYFRLCGDEYKKRNNNLFYRGIYYTKNMVARSAAKPIVYLLFE